MVLMLLILALVQVLKPQIPSGYGVVPNSVPWLHLYPPSPGACTAGPLTTLYFSWAWSFISRCLSP